jgi:hypothetical protein
MTTRNQPLRAQRHRDIDYAFWVAGAGLVLMTILVVWVPWGYDRSTGSKLWSSLGLGALGFVVGWVVGKGLASAVGGLVPAGQKAERRRDQGAKETLSRLTRSRDRFAVILLLLAVAAVTVTWFAYDIGWAHPATRASAAVGQVAKFALTLVGAFIGHHFEMKNHLKRLRELEPPLKHSPVGQQPEKEGRGPS